MLARTGHGMQRNGTTSDATVRHNLGRTWTDTRDPTCNRGTRVFLGGKGWDKAWKVIGFRLDMGGGAETNSDDERYLFK